MALNVGELQAKLTLSDMLTPALTMASKQVTEFGGKLEKMGDKAKSVGQDLMPLSIGLAAIGTASLVMAGKFEASMTRLVSIAGVGAKEIDGVRESILNLSLSSGVGPQMLADAMTKISSVVSDTAVAMDILTTATAGTKAGFGDTVDVAGALTTVINSYGDGMYTAARAGDILAETIKEGGAEAKELAPTLANVIPFAAQMGISFEEVGANLATLTKLGVPAAEAVTQLSAVMTAAVKETKQGAEALDSVGMSYEGLRASIKDKGLMATLIELDGKFKGNITGLTDVFGRIEALRSVMGTASSQGDTYAKVLETIKKSSDKGTGSLQSMADAMDGQVVQSFAQVKATVEVLAIKIGNELAPAFIDVIKAATPVLQWAIDAVKWFSDLSPWIKTTAISVGALAAAAAPMLLAFSSFSKVIKITSDGVGAMVSGTRLAITAIDKLTTAAKTSELAFIALRGAQAGLIGLGIGAAVAGATYLWNDFNAKVAKNKENFDKLNEASEKAGHRITDLAMAERILEAASMGLAGTQLTRKDLTIDETNAWLRAKDAVAGMTGQYSLLTGGLNINLEAARAALAGGAKQISGMEKLDAAIEAAKNELAGFSDENKRAIEKADKFGWSVNEIATELKLGEKAVQLYVDKLKASTKETEKAGKEQEELKEFIKKTNDEWKASGEASERFMGDVTKSTERLTAAIIDNFTKQKDAEREAALVSREMTQSKFNFAMDNVDLWLQNELLTIDKSVVGWEAAQTAMMTLAATRKAQIIKDSKEIQEELASMPAAMKEGLNPEWLMGAGFSSGGPPPDATGKWKDHINEIGSAFADMFEGVNNDVAQIFKVLGEGLSKMTAEGATAGTKMAVGFGMAASVVSTILGEEAGSKWGAAAVGALGGAASGAAIGAMFTPIGAGVGAAIGAVVGAVGGWVSAQKNAIAAQKEATAQVQKLKGALVEQYGSLENLEEISSRLFGMSFVGEWGNEGAEGLKKMTEFTKDFEDRMKKTTEAVNKMMFGFAASTAVLTAGTGDVSAALTKATDEYNKLKESGTATSEQLKAASDGVTAALEHQYEVGQSSKQMLSDLGTQGVATFSAVLLATGSYNEALAAVAPTLTTLDQAYVDLGLQVDNVLLSHLMLQAGVLEANPQLMAAIDGQAGAMQGMAQMGMLNADTFASMQRTGIELYQRLQTETANQAAATGDLGDHTVDALMPMQKYLQEATAQAELLGLPLDANTQLLIDQSKELGIWKDKGKSANDLLIEGINALNETMSALLANIGGIGNGLRSIPSNVSSTVRIHTIHSESTEGSGENAADGGLVTPGGMVHMAGGGEIWQPHGSDQVPAMLTPGERVLTVSQNNAYERDMGGGVDPRMLNALNRLTDAVMGQSDALLIGLRDVLLERG